MWSGLYGVWRCNRDSLMTAPLSDVSSSLVPLRFPSPARDLFWPVWACYVGCHPTSFPSADDATLAAQTHVLPLANPLAHRSELSASAVASRPTGSSHPFTIQNLHRHRVVCPHFVRSEEPSGSLSLSLLVGSCVWCCQPPCFNYTKADDSWSFCCFVGWFEFHHSWVQRHFTYSSLNNLCQSGDRCRWDSTPATRSVP